MSCCGGNKSDGKIKTIARIAEGFTKFAVSKVGIKFPYVESRYNICASCDKITWLKKIEFFQWLIDNKLEVAQKFDNLENVSDLPMKPRRAVTSRYCTVCKCNILAKIHSEAMKCPLEKW